MVLFTGVQHLCTFNIYHLLPMFGWRHTLSASIFVDVSYRLHYSMDKFISCVVLVLPFWWRDYNCMDLGQNNAWWHRTTSFFMTMQGVTSLLSWTSCAAGNGRFWNIHIRRKLRHLVVQNHIILHDNARSHTTVFTDHLHRWKWEILEHSPYSPMSPCNYDLFP